MGVGAADVAREKRGRANDSDSDGDNNRVASTTFPQLRTGVMAAHAKQWVEDAT